MKYKPPKLATYRAFQKLFYVTVKVNIAVQTDIQDAFSSSSLPADSDTLTF